MNITEMFHVSIRSVINFVDRSNNVIDLIKSDIFWHAELSDRLLWIFISGSNIISFLILKFFLSLLSISLIIVLISLFKSFQTKHRYVRRTLNHKNELIDPKINLVPPKYFGFNATSSTSKVLEKWLIGYSIARDECEGALNENDSLKVVRRLPWSQTRPNVETLNWLNVTVTSFWPSIKHFLDIFVFKNLLEPIQRRSTSIIETNGLSKDEAKLSILISTRRKLQTLRNQEKSFRQKSKGFPRYYSFLAYFTLSKIIIIYLKRFFVDYFVQMFKKPDKREVYKVNLNKFLSIKKILETKAHRDQKRPKTCSNNVSSKKKEPAESPIIFKMKKRCKSAPSTRSKKVFAREGSRGLISLNELRKKRIKVSTRLSFVSKKEVVLEEINLGSSAPRIGGIELIEGGGYYSCGKNLLDTTESNITERDKSFALELCYQTDEQFRLTLNSIPLLGHISLTKFNIQSRFMLTLERPISELNKDLKIFDTPDDIPWPLVNCFQVALIDVPMIDWHFERVTGSVGGKGKCRWPMSSENSTTSKRGQARWFPALASRYLNPIRVLNHTYFKYLLHSCLCLSLSWFKPFDVKIGDKLYVKSNC